MGSVTKCGHFGQFCLPATSICRLFASKAKANTTKYLRKQATDEFAVKAREHSYRARSAFKLIEIDDRFEVLKPGEVYAHWLTFMFHPFSCSLCLLINEVVC